MWNRIFILFYFRLGLDDEYEGFRCLGSYSFYKTTIHIDSIASNFDINILILNILKII